MKQLTLVIIGLTLACPILFLIWANLNHNNVAAAKPEIRKKVEPKKQRPRIADSVAIVPADYDWTNMDKATLDDLVSMYGSNSLKTVNGFAITTTVKFGETLIPSIYESKPGEFVLTKLTPRRITDGAGQEIIKIDVSSFTYGAGGVADNTNQTVTIKPGFSNNVIDSDNEGSHTIKIRTMSSGNANEIKVSASGKYQQFSRPLK